MARFMRKEFGKDTVVFEYYKMDIRFYLLVKF